MKRDERGAVYVETLVAFLPVVFFFLAVWQVTDACAAHLIVKRAASAAVRAAVVVLPDNGKFYGMAPNDGLGQADRARKDDVETAARLVLAASPHFTSTPSQVQVSGLIHAARPRDRQGDCVLTSASPAG